MKNRKQKTHKTYKKNKTQDSSNKYMNKCIDLDSKISSGYETCNTRMEYNIKRNSKQFSKFANVKTKSNNVSSCM